MGVHRIQQRTGVGLLFIFFMALFSCAQQKKKEALDQIESYEINKKNLEMHLSVLAHDSLEGRETGTDGIEKAAQYIENQFQRIGLKSISDSIGFRQWYFIYNKVPAFNVIGMIEGDSLKDEYVVISGHYDHLGIGGASDTDSIYNGADDNGSGTAAILVIAEKMFRSKMQGNGPKRNVVFMLFSGEEKGLLGSEYFVDHSILDLEKVSIDVNIDMIGRIDTERKTADTSNYVHVVGTTKMSSELPVLLDQVNGGHSLVLDGKFDDPNDSHRIFYRSDHFNFAKKGVPILFFYDGMLQGDYHELTDHIEFIDWAVYEKRTRFIYDFIATCANRPNMLKRDIPFE